MSNWRDFPRKLNKLTEFTINTSPFYPEKVLEEEAHAEARAKVASAVEASILAEGENIEEAIENAIINHPPHYTEGRQFEPIDVIEDWALNYHVGNALKYISRAGRKDSYEKDLKKAIWYLQREVDKVGGRLG